MYIGNDLQIAHPSYKIIDDISSGFNGSTTSFALQVSGATPVPFPISTQQVMISVNGVVQEPDPNGGAGFKLLGSNIVFSSAPANGHAFFGVINAGADYVTAGSEFPDGSATAPSFTFQDDQDTGWFRNASGDVGYSSNGSAILNFDGNGLTIAAGKGLTVDTSTLHVDATNNRVGIGVTSPLKALHVKSTGAVLRLETTATTGSNYIDFNDADENKAFIGLGSGGDDSLSVWNVKNDTVRIATNNTERMRIDSSGNVGIGVTSASAKLHVLDDAYVKGSSGDGSVGIQIRSGSSAIANQHQIRTGGGSGDMLFIEAAGSSGQVVAKTNGTTALTLDSSQNATFAGGVGCGAAPGSYKLQVTEGSGNEIARFSGANSSNLVFRNATSNEMLLYVPSGDSLKFATNGYANVALTLDSSQNATFAGAIANTGSISSSGGTNNQILLNPNDGCIELSRSAGAAFIDFKNSTGEDYDVRLQESSGGLVCTGSVSDSKGNLRSIPLNTQSSAYVAVAADAGKTISISSGGVTINASVFSAGDAVTIINNSGSDQTITSGSGGMTLHNTADAATGNRTLAGRGMATIYFLSSGTAYISGAGLS
jgi:hypothetical protein